MMGSPTQEEIQAAIRRGDVNEMKALAAQAEDTLDQQGNLASALEELKSAIAAKEGS